MKNLLIGLSFLTLTLNAFALTPQKIYAESVSAILYLKTGDGGSGTGFFLKEGKEIFLITNNHMVQDEKEPQKEAKDIDVSQMTGVLKNNRPYSGFKLLYTDPKSDIAILEVPENQDIDKYLELADPNEEVVVGDETFWIGNPAELKKFTFSSGYIGNIQLKGLRSDLQLHGVGFHGSSGSPYLNKEGKIIGILCAAKPKPEKINIEKPVILPNGRKAILYPEYTQWKEYEGVTLGSTKESILKAINEAKKNKLSEDTKIINNINKVSQGDYSEKINKVESKNDLASLIRELKAYTPPEERKLGSL